MSTTGFLRDFALPEMFQFIDKGRRTGVLRLRALPDLQTTLPQVHYLWMYQGRIVAAADRLDQRGLMKLIKQRYSVSNQVGTKLFQLYQNEQPLGLCLKHQGVLKSEQLKALFQVQVLQPVCALFQLKDAQFKFDQNVPIPMREMTGLSIQARVLNQYRLIKVLAEKIETRCLDRCFTLTALPVHSPQPLSMLLPK
ncbi:MAG: DUF4388 domain-containing protein [Coleofasciculus sp. S288]|nr:DUF4388 domain-containing protein [Coleofasciculus sp. S288]